MRFLTIFLILFAGFSTVFAQKDKSETNNSVKEVETNRKPFEDLAKAASNKFSTQILYALFDSEWENNLKENPTFASYLGDKRYNDKWSDESLTAIEKQQKHRLEILEKLKQIDRSKLSVSDQLNYDLFRKNYEEDIEGFKFKRYLLPINQQGGIQTQDDLSQFINFQTVKDYEDWIARLNTFPEFMEQTIALLKEGKKENILWAKAVLERVPAQIDKQITATAEENPFYTPFKKFSKEIPEAEQTRLKNLAKVAINSKIIPSYKKLKEYFSTEYLPATYKEAGIWQMPNGKEYYDFLARSYTTTNLTPQEIHEKGLAEVKRIRAEMEKIKTQVGFEGTLQEFFTFLRTDPKFFYKTPEELLNGYRAIAKKVDPELVKIFRTLPRMPYGVIPIPDNIAPDTTTAYYNGPAADGSRPGYYYVNLYKPETRPKWEMMALSVHEAVPGHHLQIALQQELGEVPNFRKFGGYTAFTEGWGLYSESLGEDMGLYGDPYDKFGQLTYEMWRAVRLVVDTGIHYYKWDRQRAIDFFKENAAKTDQDIVNEIDRYISDPGQALAYKIGELKIKELRAKSKNELGDKFDIKDFHDVVLLSGAVPLDILERNVDEYIAKKKGVKSASTTRVIQLNLMAM
jgi:prolyl oligopeptidase